ncbi:MAG: hypothetical protein M1459_02400 [Patescibacteria group bacterium]|nr:hypothetical protein [Patescibacteria group bacterium]
MKRTIYIIVVSGLVTLTIMYFSGSFGSDSFSKIDSSTSKYTDRGGGFSFSYPSIFSFKKNTYGMGYGSNSIGGVQLGFNFIAAGTYSSLCASLPRLVENPTPNKLETFTRDIVNGYTVYKDIDLSGLSPAGFNATYAISYQGSCLTLSESNRNKDFDVLDSILNSVRFE